MTDNVTDLPVKFKRPVDEDGFLKIVNTGRCPHGPFLVDEQKAEVECEKCGDRLNAMAVLSILARHEARRHELHVRYEEEKKRIAERSRTKCQHCGELTRISAR